MLVGSLVVSFGFNVTWWCGGQRQIETKGVMLFLLCWPSRVVILCEVCFDYVRQSVC